MNHNISWYVDMRRKEGPSFLLKFLPNPPNWSPDSLILSYPDAQLPPLPAFTKFYTWLPETVQNSIKFYGIRLKYGSPAIKFYEYLLLLLLPQLLPNPPNPEPGIPGFMAYCIFYDTLPMPDFDAGFLCRKCRIFTLQAPFHTFLHLVWHNYNPFILNHFHLFSFFPCVTINFIVT